MDAANVKIEPGWKRELAAEFDKPYMGELRRFLTERQRDGGFYPPAPLIFNALNLTAFDEVKVVILGQDPYHGEGQAMGLAFSVPDGVKIPPSLRNMFKELEDDLGVPAPASGDLSGWARQGVLLLNTVLTVDPGAAGSHAGRGWEWFTGAAIDALNRDRSGLVFCLWGVPAQRAGARVDRERHTVIESPHPSPLSAYRGFFGSRPFSRINAELERRGVPRIDWAKTA